MQYAQICSVVTVKGNVARTGAAKRPLECYAVVTIKEVAAVTATADVGSGDLVTTIGGSVARTIHFAVVVVSVTVAVCVMIKVRRSTTS